MGACHRENGAAKALLADPCGRYAEGRDSGCGIGHKAVGTADKDLSPDQPFDPSQMLIIESPLQPLPVIVRLAQDQGQLHACLTHGVQLGGSRNVGLAAAQVHKVHVVEFVSEMQGAGDGDHGGDA